MEATKKWLQEVKELVAKGKTIIESDMTESQNTHYLSGLDLAREEMEAAISRAELVLDDQKATEASFVDNCRALRRVIGPMVGHYDFENKAIRPWLT